MSKKDAQKPAASGSGSVDEGKICAILAYLLIGVIWYFVDEKMKKNSFVRFHVKQGLVVLAISIVFWIVQAVLIMPLMFVPGLGWGLFTIFRLIGLAILVLVIIGIVYAAQGKQNELPVVGKFGSRFNI